MIVGKYITVSRNKVTPNLLATKDVVIMKQIMVVPTQAPSDH